MMDIQHINRLREAQDQDLRLTEEKVSKLSQFVQDYEALELRLSSLADKLTHDIMVPFGSIAFMPGHLVHTNEILVLFGDDWFVDRSTKQCIEIIHRRIAVLRSQIEDFNKQKYLLESRLKFTGDIVQLVSNQSDMVEINEPYDEQREQAWRATHEKNLREQQQNSKQRDMSRSAEDEALWRRLQELEEAEEANNELSADSDTEVLREASFCEIPAAISQPSSDRTQLNPVPCGSSEVKFSDSGSSSKKVTWLDKMSTESCKGDGNSNGSSSDDDDDDEPLEMVIHFKHSSIDGEFQLASADGDTGTIESPADIFRVFARPSNVGLPSILKSSASTGRTVRFEKDSSLETTVHFDSSGWSTVETSSAVRSSTLVESSAVSSDVLERTTDSDQQSAIEVLQRSSPVSSSLSEPRKVSKFKASRKH